MLFNSFEFFLFFCIVFLVYWRLPFRAQNIFLLITSCIFYAAWDWRFLALLFACKGVSYYTAAAISRTDDLNARRWWLVGSLGFNLGVLAFFKYCNFFLDNFYSLLGVFGMQVSGHALNIVLPLGISFFTFQAMSYTIDVYRKTVRPSASFLDYMAYVSFFPQLIAGPIERATNLLPQILKPRVWDNQNFYQGAYLFFWGLFQKIFVADNLGRIVNPVFANPHNYSGGEVLIAMYAFVFQLFCDFAGYSNMARGLGLMLGLKLLVNFNLPFWRTNVQEFWNKWHMSLSHWIRDYLYIPLLGGLRRIPGNSRVYTALIIAMTLMGLWHGASWNFVVFGLYYGILLSLYVVIRARFATFILPKSKAGQALWFWARVIFMFQITALGMALFRSTSMTHVGQVLGRLCDFSSWSAPGELWLKLFAFAMPVLIFEYVEFKTNDTFFVFNKINYLPRVALFAFMTYLMLGWGVMTAQEFIYFQF